MEKERLALLDQVAGNTVDYRRKQWIDNFFANRDAIHNSYGVVSLINTLVDVPAILIGSGPTLNYNVDRLKGLEHRACLVTGASGLHGLIEEGVKPHLVMVTDSKERCVEYLADIDISGLTFIVDTFVHPVVVDRLKDARRIYWYNTLEMERIPFTRLLDEYTGYIGKISTGGCGVTTGWCLIRHVLKCDPDILVGLPEGFYDPGARGNPGSAQQYSSLLTKHHKVEVYSSENIEMTDMYGRLVYTKAGFLSFAWWFSQSFVDVHGIHINCSEGGILKENCLNMPLAFCADRYLTTKRDIESRLFAHERQADAVVEGLEVAEEHHPLLTCLVSGPSLSTLTMRTGWTEKKVKKVISDLCNMGVPIKEAPYSVQSPSGNSISSVMYTLEKEEQKQDVSGEEPS